MVPGPPHPPEGLDGYGGQEALRSHKRNNIMTRFIVTTDGLLGYTNSVPGATTITMTVLAARVLDGGDPLLLDKVIVRAPERVRTATSEDFNNYRVSEKGYRDKPQQYIYERN